MTPDNTKCGCSGNKPVRAGSNKAIRWYRNAQLDTDTAHLLQTFRCHDLKMDRNIIDQVEPYIHKILRNCSAVNLEGRELHELNALVGRAGKLIFIQSLPVCWGGWGSSKSLSRVEQRSRYVLSHYLGISTSSQIRSTVVSRQTDLQGYAGRE